MAHATEPLSAETSARLVDLARACKGAARVVAMYPATHPAIQDALARMTAAGTAAVAGGPFQVSVTPETLLVGGRALGRPDVAVTELAGLLHAHSVGELLINQALTPAAWHAFLLLITQSPADLRGEGGITRAWSAAGGGPIEIRQIDYGEVLRERALGDESSWEFVLTAYLEGEQTDLDDEVLAELCRDCRRSGAHGRVHRQRGRAQRQGRLDQPQAGAAGQAAAGAGRLHLADRRVVARRGPARRRQQPATDVARGGHRPAHRASAGRRRGPPHRHRPGQRAARAARRGPRRPLRRRGDHARARRLGTTRRGLPGAGARRPAAGPRARNRRGRRGEGAVRQGPDVRRPVAAGGRDAAVLLGREVHLGGLRHRPVAGPFRRRRDGADQRGPARARRSVGGHGERRAAPPSRSAGARRPARRGEAARRLAQGTRAGPRATRAARPGWRPAAGAGAARHAAAAVARPVVRGGRRCEGRRRAARRRRGAHPSGAVHPPGRRSRAATGDALLPVARQTGGRAPDRRHARRGERADDPPSARGAGVVRVGGHVANGRAAVGPQPGGPPGGHRPGAPARSRPGAPAPGRAARRHRAAGAARRAARDHADGLGRGLCGAAIGLDQRGRAHPRDDHALGRDAARRAGGAALRLHRPPVGPPRRLRGVLPVSPRDAGPPRRLVRADRAGAAGGAQAR